MTLFLSNCNCPDKNNHWDEVNINPDISGDSIYKQLDKQHEIFSFFEGQDSLMKRTSDVAYFSGKKINLQENKYSKLNNCRAYLHSDTLSINIGIGNGFSSKGFIIHYANRKFYAEPYYSTDIVVEGECEPTYKIVYQKLTLDKRKYKPGDSLYGRIEFKSIETEMFFKRTEHFGIGNFRTKVRRS